MELSLSRSRDHKWKIPVPIGPIFWEHVTSEPICANSLIDCGKDYRNLLVDQVASSLRRQWSLTGANEAPDGWGKSNA
jgi:hypothetical protein